jgi:hypothetical protein
MNGTFRKSSGVRSDLVNLSNAVGSGGFIYAGKKGLAEAFALFFEVIQEPLGPDEFGGEDAEAKKSDKQSGSRRKDQHGADNEQGETDDDFRPAFRLSDCFDQHRCRLFLLD